MRHRKSGRKLNRNSSHRKAMFRNMVTSLFKHDRIKTTDAKAKELRILADHIVTLAKRGDLHARRQALSIIREKDVVHKLFEEAGDRFGSVAGGYTRIVKIGTRPGDSAPVSLIELVTPGSGKPKSKKKKVIDTAAVAASVVTEEAVADSDAETEVSAAPDQDAEETDAKGVDGPDDALIEPEIAQEPSSPDTSPESDESGAVEVAPDEKPSDVEPATSDEEKPAEK